MAQVETVDIVLAVQDTTQLDWTAHPAITGLGLLSTERQRGLLAHTTLVITPERVPLGLLAQERWIRPVEEAGKKHTRRARSIAQKESHKWLTSVQAVCAAKEACPPSHVISVGDAEADVDDLFLLKRPPAVDLLVRAAQDRRLAEPEQQRLPTATSTRPPLCPRSRPPSPRPYAGSRSWAASWAAREMARRVSPCSGAASSA